MNKFAYDTLGASRDLEAAGMERRQAEAVAIAIARREGNLATKSDLNLLRTEVKFDISKVKFDITEIRLDMKAQFRWVISMQVVVAFAVITLVYAIVQ